MDGVEEVRQLDDTHLHWVAEFGGSRHEWDAEVTEQRPDERVAWRNTEGKDNAGAVTFHRIDAPRAVPDLLLEPLGDEVHLHHHARRAVVVPGAARSSVPTRLRAALSSRRRNRSRPRASTMRSEVAASMRI
jgi:uncharacterized membrane protein